MLQTATDNDNDRRRQAKQYWPIKRASKNAHFNATQIVDRCYVSEEVRYVHQGAHTFQLRQILLLVLTRHDRQSANCSWQQTI